MHRTWYRHLVVVLVAAGVRVASAQETPVPEGTPLPPGAWSISPARLGGPVFTPSPNGLPTILLTGYWPPTNEMLRQFSRNLDQNPGGWVGEDWEGRGYNVYAYFPEFPEGLGKGEGDFEVDYQDTSADWWPLLDAAAPIGLITFSRAGATVLWEMEGGNRTYAPGNWTNDYLVPLQPTPELPISSEPPLMERFSTQPIDEIVANIASSGIPVTPIVMTIDTGAFLSNCIGYHGNWHHDLHADAADPKWNIAGGHVHVGYNMSIPDAVAATEVTVRTLISHLDSRRALLPLGDVNGSGVIDTLDHALSYECLAGPGHTTPPAGCLPARFDLADLDDDGDVDLADHATLSSQLGILADPVLLLPFEDQFSSAIVDSSRWAENKGTTIDGVGTSEPSAPLSARFNGDPTGGDQLTSHTIDLFGQSDVHLQYAWQRRGGGNSPETGDDLFVEYRDITGQWQLIHQHLGSGVDMIIYQLEDVVLPAQALHSHFRLRIRSRATTGVNQDDWFVDDVFIDVP
jgi:hypothetical protein